MLGCGRRPVRPAALRRGHPRAAGPDVDDGAGGVLGGRGESRVRNAASTSLIGACDTATVGASSRRSSCSRRRGRPPGPAASGSSHRTNDAAMPTRSWPCRRATSSIRYVSPCGTGVLECLAKKRVQFACGLADVEGMPDRCLADAVHHRRAGGLDGGHRAPVARPGRAPAARAPRPSGRPAPGSGRSARAAPRAIAAIDRRRPRRRRSARGRCADRAAAHQAERVRLVQQVGDGLGL